MSNQDNSYKRYAQYRANRHHYKVMQVAAPIAVCIIIAVVTKFWWVLAIGVVIIAVIKGIAQANARDDAAIDAKMAIAQDTTAPPVEPVKVQDVAECVEGLSPTDAGYINKRQQKNLGKTDKPGTDNYQWFYEMECQICKHRYYSNGTNIKERKCPNCQGGKE